MLTFRGQEGEEEPGGGWGRVGKRAQVSRREPGERGVLKAK